MLMNHRAWKAFRVIFEKTAGKVCKSSPAIKGLAEEDLYSFLFLSFFLILSLSLPFTSGVFTAFHKRFDDQVL